MKAGSFPLLANRSVSGSDKIIARCQEWVALSYPEPNPVQLMVDLAGLNSRTFARQFCTATGRNAIDYVRYVRIEEVKQMLETTIAPIDDISEQVGYVDPRRIPADVPAAGRNNTRGTQSAVLTTCSGR